MTAKAPLAIGEEIRRLGYLEDGGWNLKKLESEFARMREIIGPGNPHFESVFLTFESCTESIESFFSQFRSDADDVWLEANNLYKDFETFHEAFLANPSKPIGNNSPEQFTKSVSKIRRKVEYLESRILETVDAFAVHRALKMMRMACLSFLSVAATAQWPKSPGKPESKINGDDKSKMDYVRDVFRAHPDMKVEAVYITAKENFEKVHPGMDFVTIEHVAKYFKKKIRQRCPGQLELNLSLR
jgi:hypothetical protein